jgi:hypothetical protein
MHMFVLLVHLPNLGFLGNAFASDYQNLVVVHSYHNYMLNKVMVHNSHF